MNAAQIAVAILAGVLIAACTILLITEHEIWGSIFGGVALLGFLSLLSMIVTDRRT